ncbi:alpha/beta hydrolase [Streptomyces sp. NPDC001380]|uniref:alpha/beta hydrolase n=1 Tax=Streptomyces sp. NPDC001380 TaxID=3364566 RepID=UPI00367412D8
MPIGYLATVGVVVVGTLLALAPLRRPRPLGTLSWFLSAVVNESPFAGLSWVLAATLLACTQGDFHGPAVLAAAGAVCTVVAATPVLARRALRAGAAVDRALDEGLGPGFRAAGGTGDGSPAGRVRRLPWVRILLAPLPLSRRGVRRTANLPYGPHGRRNRLDVHRGRDRSPGAPILIHLHGGGFRTGRKSFYARALLHGFARQGWVCISANYRLRPGAAFHDFVVDVKRVIVWAREHAPEHGADPACIVLAGSSAGAHLAVTAAFTAGDPAFQPGFEDEDTSVAAAIGLYGYYGRIEPGPQPSSPADHVRPGVPPLLIAHGDQDTFVPPGHARRFVADVRAVSAGPVVHVELPGAQHSFDLFHSIRFAILIDGLQTFTSWVRSPGRAAGPGAPPRT